MNIYRPQESASEDPVPVILWIHGGAFQSGTRRGVMERILNMTTLGYAVVSMDHRLAPDFLLDDMIEDIGTWCVFCAPMRQAMALTLSVLGPQTLLGGFLAALLGTSEADCRF